VKPKTLLIFKKEITMQTLIKTHIAAGIIPCLVDGGYEGNKFNGKLKFLLIRTNTDGVVTRWWEFPKGHIEKGETLLETAKRETEEETGLVINDIHPSFRHESNYFIKKNYSTGKKLDIPEPKTVTYFLGIAPTKEVKLSFEHSEYGWFTADEANEKLKYSSKKEVLEHAIDILKL